MSAGVELVAWRDPWDRWRDRLLASPRFRRWAAGFPLTRWIARRRAAALFDLVGGFVYSQVLLACVRLRLFEHLADGPLTSAQVAPRLRLDPAAAECLLAAAAAIDLVELRQGQRWGLGPLGAVLVGDEAIVAMIEHHEALYADLADPVALLRGETASTRLERFWPYAMDAYPASLPAQRVADYSALMAASQPLVAGQVLDAVSLDGHRCLLDVGGGEGAFVAAVAQRAPHLALMVFDLPTVAERARARLAAQGLAQRADVHGGDFLRDPLPRGADVVTLVRVLHDHDDAQALQLLRSVHAALPPGGRVLVAEPMAGTSGARAVGDAYFGFYLLAMRRGRPRTPQRISQLLRHAGFHRVRTLSTAQPLQAGVVSAFVPAGPRVAAGSHLA
jgi:demethylspheroidene O-methyltransferase